MEAILKFKLPEESAEHKLAIDGGTWSSAMWDLDQWLRSEIKHGGKEQYQPVRDMLHSILQEAGLSLE